MLGAHRDTFGTLDFLRNLPLFRDLSMSELESLADATTERRVAPGITLFGRGDPCDGLYFIVLGRVKLALLAAGGAEKVIDILGPGQSFDEAAVFTGKPHLLFAETMTESMLLHVAKPAILETLAANADFARQLVCEMSQRVCRLVSDIEGYTLRSATARVTGYLSAALDEGLQSGEQGDVQLAASKSVLASRLNITREHFSRILHELTQAGLIRVSGRTIRVLDRDALRQRNA